MRIFKHRETGMVFAINWSITRRAYRDYWRQLIALEIDLRDQQILIRKKPNLPWGRTMRPWVSPRQPDSLEKWNGWTGFFILAYMWPPTTGIDKGASNADSMKERYTSGDITPSRIFVSRWVLELQCRFFYYESIYAEREVVKTQYIRKRPDNYWADKPVETEIMG